MKKEAPNLEVTAVSEGENNQELFSTIKELKSKSDTEFANMIEGTI